MTKELKKGKSERKSVVAVKALVAVKASKEIPKTALVWALTNVAQPGDCITLLVAVPSQTSGKKSWGFPRFAGDCASDLNKSHSGSDSEHKTDLTDSCSQMILQLQDVYDPNKINVKIKIVGDLPFGFVSAEAKSTRVNWVILDKHLSHERKQCMEDLHCNIVVMKGSQPNVLRLNLVGSSSHQKEPEASSPMSSELDKSSRKEVANNGSFNSTRGPPITCSPKMFTGTVPGTSSVSSSNHGTSPFFAAEMSVELKKNVLFTLKEDDTESHWRSSILEDGNHTPNDKPQSSTLALMEKFSTQDEGEGVFCSPCCRSNVDFRGNIKEVILPSCYAWPIPPLCSICQHKAPVFGKPPRLFKFAELELATGCFSPANFLPDGGFGSVHRGVLPDGRVVAVKQHKLASSQGDQEFCSEVEVLSCAQHRNVVMLIGFCIEHGRRLLVYEFICNGSLDSHLYGHDHDPLEWSSRQKIAVGTARGLRYLHEECRGGCIIHRNIHPNNILITHDFEPLVGLARWQPDGDTGVGTQAIGTFWYLAPEYEQSGKMTDKADVYSFGVVLVQLVTGRKAVDLNRPEGQQCLIEWARPLLEEYAINELVDPRLGTYFSKDEVHCMLHAAALCIRREPQLRPRMSQVLRILDVENNVDMMPGKGYDVGNRSGRISAVEGSSRKISMDGTNRRKGNWGKG